MLPCSDNSYCNASHAHHVTFTRRLFVFREYFPKLHELRRQCGVASWGNTSYHAVPGPVAANFYGTDEWDVSAVSDECKVSSCACICGV